MRRLTFGVILIALAWQGRCGVVQGEEPQLGPYFPAAGQSCPVQESALPAYGTAALGNEGRHRPVYDWLRRPFGCRATHNSVGCGSLKSECEFIFGSCRTFYNEGCLKGPQPWEVAGYPGVSTGYPGGSEGCGCP